jgi:S1-C subfamily serine protease
MSRLEVVDIGEGNSAHGIGSAIAGNQVRAVAPRLFQYGKVVQSRGAYLGVSLTGTRASDAQSGTLAKSSPAAAEGVQHGDIIAAIDGQSVANGEDVRAVLAAYKQGDKIRPTLKWNGQTVCHGDAGRAPRLMT